MDGRLKILLVGTLGDLLDLLTVTHLERMRTNMKTLKAFQKAHREAILRGESIYADMAGKYGIPAPDALNAISSMLSSTWIEVEHFLADLGKDDPLAIIEARSHFNLDEME